MSVGLRLRAKLKQSVSGLVNGAHKQLLADIDHWISDYCSQLRSTNYLGERDGNPTLFCRLHPAAEDMEVSLRGDTHLIVSAATSSAGPGYHIFVCDMLHKLAGPFQLQWEDPDEEEYLDETGYFHSGNRQNVVTEMTIWLKSVCSWFFDGNGWNRRGPVGLAMSIGTNFKWNAPAITSLGPRDEKWLRKTAEDGNNGQDFFPWWSPELDVQYFLRRALVTIWSDVRWRPPYDEAERNTLNYVVDSLETAYRLDSSLAYPWAEWAAILGYLERNNKSDQFVRDRAGATQPTTGYRRSDVSVQLPGNWWITLPGSFSNFLPDEDHNYCACDPPREVWVTSFIFKGDLAASLQSEREEIRKREQILVHEAKNYIASARIQQKSNGEMEWFSLTSSNIGLGHRAVCTIIFTKPEERDWAIQVWKSLQPPPPAQE